MSEYTTQLFSHVPAERLSTFSCGHIVPPENLRAVVLNRGPRGSDLEFKFGTREDPALVGAPSASCNLHVVLTASARLQNLAKCC